MMFFGGRFVFLVGLVRMELVFFLLFSWIQGGAFCGEHRLRMLYCTRTYTGMDG